MQAAPNLTELFAEYAKESANPELGFPIVQFPIYKVMEDAGLLHIFAAFHGEELVGFLVLICSVLPHFGKLVASSESIFVSAPHRKTGAGLKLIASAERRAKELGAIGFYISSPIGGDLYHVLNKSKSWRATNQQFFKGLADAA